MVRETICPPSFLAASPFFYTSFSLFLYVYVQVLLFRAGTCLFSLYPKQLGVVVKTEEHGEEHGPVRHRVLNCSISSLLLGPLLHYARPFFQERSGMPRTKSSLAISQAIWTFIVCPRQCLSSAQALGPNVKWVGVINSLAPQQPLKILLSDPLVGEEGFGDVEPISRLAQLCPSSMSVSLHLLGKCSWL